jgi:hypothetical protein
LKVLARPPGFQTLLKVQTPSKAFNGLSKLWSLAFLAHKGLKMLIRPLRLL